MKAKKVKEIQSCRICKSKKLYDFFDLGEMPIPNGFLKKEDLNKSEPKYPLSVCLCEECFLVQLREVVNPEVMFKNYLYIPSTSGPRVDQFHDLAQKINKFIPFSKKTLSVDIGSNDGSLLTVFKTLGSRVLGIDPAENLVKVAQMNGVETVLAYFDPKTADEVKKKYGQASVITATNVMAHIADINGVIEGVSRLLKDDGIFVAHFPYLIDLINKMQFDTIYHEHLSYFSIKSLVRLVEKTDLEIFHIEHSELDGGSVRVYWKKRDNNKIKVNTNEINKYINTEEKNGFYSRDVYDIFVKKVQNLKKDIQTLIEAVKNENKIIVGYGASARGNIALNYYGIGAKTLEYIVDSTPYKQGLYTPATHIPIYAEKKIYETHPDYILILAWNFKEAIMRKNIKFKRTGGKFIVIDNGIEIY